MVFLALHLKADWIMTGFTRIRQGFGDQCRIKKFGRTTRELWSAQQLFFLTMPRLETHLKSDEEKIISGEKGHWSIGTRSNQIFAQLTIPPKMSSTGRKPIVGVYGMLCAWAACLSGSGAVLSSNGTIFEDNCKKTTTCEALKYNTCLGSPLPYTHTSLILAEDSSSQEEAFEKLTMWSGKIGKSL